MGGRSPDTCNGDCCVSFKLPIRWPQLARGDVGDMDTEEARLLSLLFVPITHNLANERQQEHVQGEKQTFTEDDHTFMCKAWDSVSRKCGVYAYRPAGCRTFPYGSSCRYGCSCKGTEPEPRVIV